MYYDEKEWKNLDVFDFLYFFDVDGKFICFGLFSYLFFGVGRCVCFVEFFGKIQFFFFIFYLLYKFCFSVLYDVKELDLEGIFGVSLCLKLYYLCIERCYQRYF